MAFAFKNRLKVVSASVITGGVLLAVVGTALASLGSGVFSSGASLENPLTFDAPTWAVAQEKVIDKDAARTVSRPLAQPDGEVVLLDDFDYTAIVRGRPQPSRHFHQHHHHH